MLGEFIISTIATFLGFILAMYGDTLLKGRDEQNDMRLITEALNDELSDNRDIAKMVMSKYNDPNSNKFEYKTSVWQAIISSGLLMKLYSKKDTKHIDCINVYAIIDCASSLEHSIELCHYSQRNDIDSSELTRLKDKRLSYSTEIIEKINDIVGSRGQINAK